MKQKQKYNTKEFFYDTSFNDYKKEKEEVVVKNMKLYYVLKIFSYFVATVSAVLVFNIEIDITVSLPIWKWLLLLPFYMIIQIFVFQLMHKVVFKKFEVKYTSSAGPR